MEDSNKLVPVVGAGEVLVGGGDYIDPLESLFWKGEDKTKGFDQPSKYLLFSRLYSRAF